MSSITSGLAGILIEVERPGDFYATGTVGIFSPHLEVEGVGVIALPLLEIQAGQLIAVAERAPYGRGEETLLDDKVRRTWQIDASRVRIGGRNWAQSLQGIVARAAEGLGVSEPVQADFYKLLVYGEGDFFVRHRDTEKVPGMFATLVIVLPSIYTGGELLVRHRGREVQLDMRCPEPCDAAFAAFYADCVHEVLPITSGCRLTLIYNLRRIGGDSRPEPPDYNTQQASLTELLRQWAQAKQRREDETPEKLIYPLQHAYTPAELSFAALKGADAAAAAVLAGAAGSSGCELHLALVAIEESGVAEYSGHYRSRWGSRSSDDGNEFEAGEVCSRSAVLSNWVRLDGGTSPLKSIPFDDSEICPPGAFEDLEPDEQHFHEATGNEGASFERTYRRGAFALWPEARRLAILNQGGLAATLPYLGELTEGWIASGEDCESPLWRQAGELSGHMLDSWPAVGWRPVRDEAESEAAQMLTLLTRLKNRPCIEAFLTGLSAAGAFTRGDADAIVEAAGLLPPAKAANLFGRIVSGNAPRALSGCGRLLARSAGRLADLTGAASILVEALPGDPAKEPEPKRWDTPRAIEPGFIVDLAGALDRIDPILAERAASHLLAWPKTYGLDAVLIPSVLALTGQSGEWNSDIVRRLRGACLNHLRARIAEILEPPTDWRRDGVVSCNCQHCRELNVFLGDPGRQSWTFKAAEAKRRHVEQMVRQDRCDLHLTTERRGSPHGLVCAKNQASYERRARQRKADLENLAQLEAP